ncbi:gluconate 2-dehydrogenase subunit 3 family protein [Namhaeicola litoreus]|uniref:Gluconate 2-dehydrogenase subunit 3 family protein n=1 Tax=Namhaeicola litoreus TaxID=1052145 RepID=A0ABW3Y0P2_9FLAO
MHRRSVLKNLGLFSGGLIIFPSCTFTKEKVDVATSDMHITEELKNLLDLVIENMIPTATYPDFSEHTLSDFVLVMANDCLSPEENKSFVKGLIDFEKYCKNEQNSPFEKLSQKDQSKIIEALLLKNHSDDLSFFISKSKQFSILGFMQSAYVMTNEMPYNLIPGNYENCVTIDPSQKININA